MNSSSSSGLRIQVPLPNCWNRLNSTSFADWKSLAALLASPYVRLERCSTPNFAATSLKLWKRTALHKRDCNCPPALENDKDVWQTISAEEIFIYTNCTTHNLFIIKHKFRIYFSNHYNDIIIIIKNKLYNLYLTLHFFTSFSWFSNYTIIYIQL